jgi:hypothetical protein
MKKNRILIVSLSLLAGIGFADGGRAAQALFRIAETGQTENKNADVDIHAECVDALNQIDLNVDMTRVVSNLRLPAVGIYPKCAFSWTSSDNSIVNCASMSDGLAKVTRPAADTEVTLTARATINGDASTSATKDFKLTVLKASSTGTASELPLAYTDDFTSYETGLELSNYYKWQLTKGEGGNAKAIDEAFNYNNLVSAKALEIKSERTASDMNYLTKLNITATAAADGAAFEGYMMFSGKTNGVHLELLSGSNVVTGFGMTSSSYDYDSNGSYAASSLVSPEEGVWQKFRVEFRPATGRFMFKLFDWNTKAYVDLTSKDSTYIATRGVSSGSKGNIDGLRIVLSKGSNFGCTYLSDLKIDTIANLPENAAAVVNPNRSDGLGTIGGYQEEILTYKGSDISSLVNPSFEVHNRFNDSTVYVKDTDYTVKSSHVDSEDGSVSTYTHVFTLTKTGEIKTVTQKVYFDTSDNKAAIYDFKVSYLKAATTVDSNGKTVQVAGKGYITISGTVIRKDGTLHYLVLSHGSAAPSVADIIDEKNTVSGFVSSGHADLTSRSFSIDTAQISYPSEYDVYVATHNPNGDSETAYTENDVSTNINISTPSDLHDMSSDLTIQGSSFKLLNDIDCADYYWEFDGTTRSFTGVLDGQGHTIKNLTIANSSPVSTIKTGLFFNFNGTVKNVSFVKAKVTGLTDVGILGGNAYGCTVDNVTFTDCIVKQDEAVSGGDGYFATAVGRCRQSSADTFTNIVINNSTISAPQRSGLLVAGLTDGAPVTVKNIYASGSISIDGAHAGLIGRNQGCPLVVDNAIIDLDVINAKKEVGTVLGRNETGGTVKATNIFGDLRIQNMTQPTYFGSFIGYDAPTTGSEGKTFAYTYKNLYFLDEDYSNLGDSITPIKNSIWAGKTVEIPSEYTKQWWDTNSFIKDIDISTTWTYSDALSRPVLTLRSVSDISFTAADFASMVSQIDVTDIVNSHYFIYKAEDMLSYMSASEKAKISADDSQKLTDAIAQYKTLVSDIDDVSDGLGGIN